MSLLEFILKYGELKTLTQGTLGKSLYDVIAAKNSSKILNEYLTHYSTGFSLGKPTHHRKQHFNVYNLLDGRFCTSNLTTNPKGMGTNFILEAYNIAKPNSLLKPIVVDSDLFIGNFNLPPDDSNFTRSINPLLEHLDTIKSMHNIHVIEGIHYNTSTTYYSIDGVTSISYLDLFGAHINEIIANSTEISWLEIEVNMGLVEEAYFIINKSNESTSKKILMNKYVSILNSAPIVLPKPHQVGITNLGALRIKY